MATIEERAIEHLANSRLVDSDITKEDAVYRSYIQGATDQVKIDIDKAKNAVYSILRDYAFEYCSTIKEREETIQSLDSVWDKYLHKAMEE